MSLVPSWNYPDPEKLIRNTSVPRVTYRFFRRKGVVAFRRNPMSKLKQIPKLAGLQPYKELTTPQHRH
jgi:hypothetical protein